MDLVIDNSVCMARAFDDEAGAYCDAARGALASGRALVPARWPREVATALAVAEKRRRMKPADTECPYSWARDRGLSAYDAAYLQPAVRVRAPLVTRDAALLRAAHDAGSPIWTPPA